MKATVTRVVLVSVDIQASHKKAATMVMNDETVRRACRSVWRYGGDASLRVDVFIALPRT